MMKILIVSEGNSCRSQMAEGWLKYYAKNNAEVFSGGIKNEGLNKLAHHLMMDAVIDISDHTSDTLDKYKNQHFDFLIKLAPISDLTLKDISWDHKTEFYLEDPLSHKGNNEALVRSFVAIRNQLDDFCFDFVNEHIRNLIPEAK